MPPSRKVGGQEAFVLLDRRFAVLHALDGLPATFRRGALGQTDPLLAVDSRSPRPRRCPRLSVGGQIAQAASSAAG